MKLNICVAASVLFALTSACNKATFDSSEKTKNLSAKAQTATPMPVTPSTVEVTSETGTIEAKKQSLVVTTPSSSIKAGGETIQAKAKFKESDGTPVVIWSIKSATGMKGIGSIDQNGVYTSPATVEAESSVTIVATLKSDSTISASTTLQVLPVSQIFARCTRGLQNFPILAQVYQVPTSTTKLPNYANSGEATKITTVCMDKYAVEPRSFSDGFPDVPSLFEYFSLQTSTTLVVPTTGSYVFQLNSDDGARLSIDGREVIENDGLHQAYGTNELDSLTVGQKEVTLHLTKGEHALGLNYFQGPKFRIALVLKWKAPGSSSFVYVPTSAFK